MIQTHFHYQKNVVQTNALKAFATNHPIIFVLTSTIVWFVLLLVFTVIASSILRRPFGDSTTGSIGRLAATACVVLLLWHVGWLAASGFTRLGNWQVWLLTLAGLVYFASANLYSFYGQVAFNFSRLIRLPDSRTVITMQFVVGLSEEIMFRGLVLYALIRVWGNTTRGKIGSVVLASLLFAVLHLTHVFTYAASVSSALLLTLQASMISIWWGAFVLLSGSIWPAVVLHFVLNAIVGMQGLAEPVVQPDILAYKSLLWFSIPLGVLGIGLLLRARPHTIMSGMP